MIVSVHVPEDLVAEATREIARYLAHAAPGICAADARDLAREYVQQELEKGLADHAKDILEDITLFGLLGIKLPTVLVERARKAAQREVRM